MVLLRQIISEEYCQCFLGIAAVITSDYRWRTLAKIFKDWKQLLRQFIRKEDCQSFLGMGWYYYVRL